ncbi:uncharacterized protein LOC124133856 [Haliotis rufescens]|uniref:uncharacterized protein LOC124133856 n=1 Tax=Haliotis rufescens TaxID=6454 RepID=UPI00201F285A|nr:uncharacterized protein LOC124133856 [Haliotis rufescens]
MSNSTPGTPGCHWKESAILRGENKPSATPNLEASGNSLSTRCSLASRKLQFQSEEIKGHAIGAPRISTESWRDNQELSPPFYNTTTNPHFPQPAGHQLSHPCRPIKTPANGSGYTSSFGSVPGVGEKNQNDWQMSDTPASYITRGDDPSSGTPGLRKYDNSELKSGNGLINESHSKQATPNMPMTKGLQASVPNSINDINRCIVYSAQTNNLTPISNMLKTCQVFHPLDAVPQNPRSSPVKGQVRSLMDGGDALDVRGLASRLAKMQSETRMRDALQEYIHTHVPSVEGSVNTLIEDTVRQIATVSLRDKNPRRCLSSITTTRDWMKLQNGNGEAASPPIRNNHRGPQSTSPSPDPVSPKSTSPNNRNFMSMKQDQTGSSSSNRNQSELRSANQNSQIAQPVPTGSRVDDNPPSTSHVCNNFNRQQLSQILGVSSSEMSDLDMGNMREHRLVNEYTLPGCNSDNRKVTEVYNVGGELLYTDYVSPEERRYEHYVLQTCHTAKRKLRDVDNGEGHGGKKRMSFLREEFTDSRFIRFNNGSWD